MHRAVQRLCYADGGGERLGMTDALLLVGFVVIAYVVLKFQTKK